MRVNAAQGFRGLETDLVTYVLALQIVEYQHPLGGGWPLAVEDSSDDGLEPVLGEVLFLGPCDVR